MDFGFILLPIFLFVALIVMVVTLVMQRQAAKSGVYRAVLIVCLSTLVLFLLASGNCVRVVGEESLVRAALRGNESVVRRQLAFGTDPESEWEGTTALEAAQKGNHTEIIRLLKEAGARE